MKLELIKPIKALNKAYLKEKVSRNHIELFKKNLQQLLSRINEQESEEHLKNVIADFLKDTWYKDQFEINTKDRNDLVIHTGKTTKDAVGVILEVKKPSNKAELMTAAKPNTKALQELILYYLRERVDHNNTDIKYLVVTNVSFDNVELNTETADARPAFYFDDAEMVAVKNSVIANTNANGPVLKLANTRNSYFTGNIFWGKAKCLVQAEGARNNKVLILNNYYRGVAEKIICSDTRGGAFGLVHKNNTQ